MSRRRAVRWFAASLLSLAGLAACRTAGGTGTTAPGSRQAPRSVPVSLAAELDGEGKAWVEKTLAGLDLEGRAAQMIMVRAYGMPLHPESAAYRELQEQVVGLRVGGIVLFRSELDTIPILLDELQSAARVPLLVSADLERSLAFRVDGGTVPLPGAMAIGATRSEEAARFAGEVTAREARAVGIHWVLAPVADVNNDPGNPIINIRSFGEDPELVSRLVAAFVRGAHESPDRWVMTSVKHFPGHGDTAVDSHLVLPTIPGDRARLDRVELAPFRAAIAAGVDSVMSGHLRVPALDPSGAAATLSPLVGTTLLRDELGFRGLSVTDAMEMKGVGGAWMGEATVAAVRAGADVVLLPPDPRVAIQSLVRAVHDGTLSEARITESARRVLAAKARLGLHRARSVDRVRARRDVGRPEDVARAEAIARQAITLVRDSGGVVPLAVEKPLRVLHLVLSSDWSNPAIAGVPERELAARGIPVESRRLGPRLSPAAADEIVALASASSPSSPSSPPITHVLVSAFVRVTSSKGTAAMDPTHAALLERLAAGGVPVIVVSYGNPYLLTQFPHVPVYLCAFSWESASQRAAIAALLGESPIGGKLPVTIPGLAPYGTGVERARRDLTLRATTPEEVGFRPDGLAEVDRLLDQAVADRVFPGGVVAIGRHGRLAHLKAFGRLSYDESAAAVVPDTIYDLASLTKVIATTSVAMMMVDEGRLDLDAKVASFLPGFVGPGKEKVTVRHLLTHSAGIDWWAPLYKEVQGHAAYLERIEAMPLVAEPGTALRYSDLGIILLGEILERVSGRPLEALARERLFAPLGMRDTDWLPPAAKLTRIAPTENDPWRGRVLRGEVHDENAFALGGIAPHAGLFGTAPDLARFAQMLLWKGVYDGKRIVSRGSVESFTRRVGLPAGSSRALGWDTPSAHGSSAGSLFSPESFGHTGFTGTSLWVDPQRDLFVVLLTNRVHPTRENRKIGAVRAAVADAVVRALADGATATAAVRPAPWPVLVGLDRVAAGVAGSELAGKRLGLVAHAAAVSLEGHPALAVLRARGLDVVRLFSPEHGLHGQAAAGEKVASGVDEASGLPLVSLYGEKTKPAATDLAGLDALVVDLQDAGVRFYTYESTLVGCLEAAADAGIELVVLDRPNPLNGDRVEGPVAAPRDVVPESFLNRAPGPLVHGLTLGDLARVVNAHLAKPAKLTVIAMDGWKRTMTWKDTGRRWLDPSPNLRSPEAALAYPGVALLEGSNASEGRGTESPFLLVGSPALAGATLALDTPGFRLVPRRFTPRASAAAPQPKLEGVELPGYAVEVVDPKFAQPYRLGVALLADLLHRPGFELLRDGAALTRLLGTPKLLADLRAGRTVDEILASDVADQAAWRETRQPYLLYE